MTYTLYHYKAIITEVYDGDTCTVDIDLGLRAWMREEKIRLNRINSPELRGGEKSKGILSRDFLRSLVLNKEVIIETFKDEKEKYGRYLAEIWLKTDGDNYLNVNDELVHKGYAEYKTY